MKTSSLFKIAILLVLSFALAGCASFGHKLKAFLGGNSSNVADAPPADAPAKKGTSFSEDPNYFEGHERKYKRVTKDNFNEDQDLDPAAGSLWRKEGQSSYLFSQNNLRMMGDIINVEVEGKAASALDAKLKIIKENIARMEAPPPQRLPASRLGQHPDAQNNAQAQATPPPEAPAKADEKVADGDKAKEGSKFDNVPCRIVERNTDGSYRVKGQTSVYVGRHEYHLIVTGIVRPDDVSSELVNSSKIIDGKFDLVATNKEVKL